MNDRVYDLQYIDIDLLVPNSWNPQTQNDATFQRLVRDIRDVGFIVPCQVVKLTDGTYLIVGGEHRWKAAKELGMTSIPCLVLDGPAWQETDLQKLVTVRLNVIQGKPDHTKFGLIYAEMAAKYGTDALQGLMGFTDEKAFQKIVAGTKKAVKNALPKELGDEFNRRAEDAKTVQDLQGILQSIFAKYGDTLDQSFLIFTYGKQPHVYVATNAASRKAVDRLIEFCRDTGDDINDVLAPILDKGLDDILSKQVVQEESEEDDPL